MKGLLDVKSHYKKAKSFYLRYERLLMPASLLVGFLIDYVTFASINIRLSLTVLLVYWILAGAVIAFIQLYDAQKLSPKLKYIRLFSPLALQFFFGALLSASLIFYWFSGAFSVSWPIMGIVILLMIFNDVFRHYFVKPVLQFSVYFFSTISLFLLVLPFLAKSIAVWVFLISGILALVIFLLYVYGLSLVSEIVRQKRRLIISLAVIIFGAMNFFYFSNVIPPIPLALREAGLYHSIKISSGSYTMESEPENFIKVIFFGQTLHLDSGQKVYLYSAVFAPAELKTTIVHHWQYYDELQKKWVSRAKPSFEITGGRREGYKGFSFISNLETGSWRVYIENHRGQVLGRIRFTVKKATEQPALEEIKR